MRAAWLLLVLPGFIHGAFRCGLDLKQEGPYNTTEVEEFFRVLGRRTSAAATLVNNLDKVGHFPPGWIFSLCPMVSC